MNFRQLSLTIILKYLTIFYHSENTFYIEKVLNMAIFKHHLKQFAILFIRMLCIQIYEQLNNDYI